MGRRDLYGCEYKVKKFLNTLEHWSITQRNSEIIKDFYERLVIENLSQARIMIYLEKLKNICFILKKDLDKITENDLRKLIFTMRDRKYSDTSIDFHITTLKKLSHSLKPSIQFIQVFKFRVNVKKFSKFMPVYEQVKNMIAIAENIRDKAFISVLYESSFRPGDIMSLRKKDVEFDEYGCKLFPDGKTGEYVGRIIDSTHYLADYFNTKLQHLNENDFIWINLTGRNKGKPSSYGTINNAIKKIAEKSGITQPVCMYSFRHARNTHLLKQGYPSTFVNKISGRKANSKEIEKYEHLTNKDVDDIILEKKGLKKIKDTEEKAKQCPRCTYINAQDSRFCNRCGGILDIETAQSVMEEIRKPDAIMQKLMEDQEFKEIMLKKIKQLNLKL